VGASHGSGPVLARPGPLHGLAAHAKVVATLCFIAAVVATPRTQAWAFGFHAVIVGTVAAVARINLLALLRRLAIELPFIAFALALPVIGGGPRVDLLGVSLSRAGLWAAWSIVAKGTLGVAATAVFASATSVPQMIAAFERLRVPRALTAIMAFMIRYADVVTDEMHRTRVARESRGDRARWLWQARAVASSAGTLFVRSYERGERVFLAMTSRGYTGSMPSFDLRTARGSWARCMAPAAVASVVATVAWTAS
jgi:cobalt/nickel transport system permease protein